MPTAEEDALITQLLQSGATAQAIRAAVPHVSRTNVYYKIAKYHKHGTVGRVQTKPTGRPLLLDADKRAVVERLLAHTPNLELDDLQAALLDQTGLKVSLSTISRVISRGGLRPSGRSVRRRRKDAGVGGRGGKAKGGGVEAVAQDDEMRVVEGDMEMVEQGAEDDGVSAPYPLPSPPSKDVMDAANVDPSLTDLDGLQKPHGQPSQPGELRQHEGPESGLLLGAALHLEELASTAARASETTYQSPYSPLP